MRIPRNLTISLGAILILAVPAAPQELMLAEEWNPMVGLGAAYQSVGHAHNIEIDLSTVGKENVGGKTAYWIEMNTVDTKSSEKYLMALSDGSHMQVLQMVTQRPGEDPVETPAQPPAPNLLEIATRVGSEEITTPAGTFQCDHFRANNGQWDAWFSPKVTPFGLVQMINDEGTQMVVEHMITDAKDRITRTPRKADPAAH
jgi:hypothetical protein